MRPQEVTQGGVGASDALLTNYAQSRFNVGLQLVQVIAGATGAAIEITMEDPQGSPTWVQIQPAQVGGGVFALTTPCRGVRLNVTDGTYKLVAIQGAT